MAQHKLHCENLHKTPGDSSAVLHQVGLANECCFVTTTKSQLAGVVCFDGGLKRKRKDPENERHKFRVSCRDFLREVGEEMENFVFVKV